MARAKMFAAGMGVLVVTSPAAANEYPSVFRGEWALQHEDIDVHAGNPPCKRGDFKEGGSDILLRITRNEREAYESVCKVRRSQQSGDLFTMTLACEGEGQKWTSEEVWTHRKLYGRDLLIALVRADKRMHVYAKCQ